MGVTINVYQGRLLTQYLELNDKGNYQCTPKSKFKSDGRTNNRTLGLYPVIHKLMPGRGFELESLGRER